MSHSNMLWVSTWDIPLMITLACQLDETESHLGMCKAHSDGVFGVFPETVA